MITNQMIKAKIIAAYEQMAEKYNELIDHKPHNAYYDRPNTLSLLPDVSGKTILDAACGPGKYSAIGRRGLLLCLCLCGGVISLPAQPWQWIKKQVGSLLADTAAADQPRFIVYPTLGYSPETSWEIGASALYVYHAQRDTHNRLSELSAFAFVTLEGQYGQWLDHALYSPGDHWFFLGRLRYQRFPLKYYGIGPSTPADYQAVVDGNYLLVRERVLRRVFGSLYLGAEFDYQRLARASFNWSDTAADRELPLGGSGASNLGLGLGLVYDNRHNVLNVRQGFFGELAHLRYDPSWGSDHRFQATYLDLRWFQPVGQRGQVLAAQFFGQSTAGEPPFNQLALLGGETIMRGYYLGRLRDRNLAAAQLEYRFLPFPFSRRWGAAAFLAAGGVGPQLTDVTTNLRLAGGAGVRFLLFANKDVFTRFDVAFTGEGTGYYFYIGEAF